MKPIEYIFYDKPSYIENENELLHGQYELKEQFNYMPEIIESMLNDDKVADTNNLIVAYNNKRKDFTYLGTLKLGNKTPNIIEYYKSGEDIIAYLILKPKLEKYYPSLRAVALFKKHNNISIN